MTKEQAIEDKKEFIMRYYKKGFVIIHEEDVLHYLYYNNLIDLQKKKSLMGVLHSRNSIENFIMNTKLFDIIVGDYGCGVECCGYKMNYKIK
jgi:hypothetical protein